MKITVNIHSFERAFEKCGKSNQFSRKGLKELFEYLEELEESRGTEYELDPIALCCEYTEYKTLKAFQEDYNAEDYPDIETIEDETQVIRVGDESFIIQQF